MVLHLHQAYFLPSCAEIVIALRRGGFRPSPRECLLVSPSLFSSRSVSRSQTSSAFSRDSAVRDSNNSESSSCFFRPSCIRRDILANCCQSCHSPIADCIFFSEAAAC